MNNAPRFTQRDSDGLRQLAIFQRKYAGHSPNDRHAECAAWLDDLAKRIGEAMSNLTNCTCQVVTGGHVVRNPRCELHSTIVIVGNEQVIDNGDGTVTRRLLEPAPRAVEE